MTAVPLWHSARLWQAGPGRRPGWPAAAALVVLAVTIYAAVSYAGVGPGRVTGVTGAVRSLTTQPGPVHPQPTGPVAAPGKCPPATVTVGDADGFTRALEGATPGTVRAAATGRARTDHMRG